MIWKTWDWKFYVTTAIALAALVASQIDLSSRSFTVRLLATSPLQPALNIQNLQISINGQNVQSPYVSTIELVNTGSKPILSSDFDGALRLQMANDAKVLSAEITSTSPKNIPAHITASESGVDVAPFLANSKDSVTIATITSGPRPVFDVRARIVGIDEVIFEDNTLRRISYWSPFVNITVGYGLLFIYFLMGPVAYRNRQLTLPRGLAFCIAGLCAFASIKMLNFSGSNELFSKLPYPGIWAFVLGLASTLASGLIASRYVRRMERAGHMKS